MNIRFVGSKVESLSLVANEALGEELEDKFSFSLANSFQPDDDKVFYVVFSVELVSKSENYRLEMEYSGCFETESAITEEFKQSHFPVVNAPAIAYPFLRGFVHTLTINAGLEPIILPTVNFQALANSNSSKENQIEPLE